MTLRLRKLNGQACLAILWWTAFILAAAAIGWWIGGKL